MDYSFAMDEGALVNLPDVKPANTGVDVTNSDLVVHFGPEFNATINRSSVANVEEMQDPRPRVYFPMGVSAAVDQLGRDTLCVVTSYDGLVKVNFNREVQGKTCPTDYSGKGQTEEGMDIQFRSIILSLQNAQQFMQALRGRSVA